MVNCLSRRAMKRKAPSIAKVFSLDDELKLKAADLTRREARLVYRYHRNIRVLRGGASQLMHKLNAEQIEPSPIFDYLRKSVTKLEKQANSVLEIYIDQHVAMRWMREVGVGISQAVGIFTLVDIDKVGRHVSSLWRFAGYDPTSTHLTREEATECVQYFENKYKKEHVDLDLLCLIAAELNRGVDQLKQITRVGITREHVPWRKLRAAILSYPWCYELKEILFRVGLSFRRAVLKGGLKSPYRSVYDWRKAYEIEKNENGDYKEQAEYKLSSRNYGKKTVARACYEKGILPPAQIDARARRFAVKIFLVHLHEILYYERYSEMPDKPYILDSLGKEHEISCPKWPFK